MDTRTAAKLLSLPFVLLLVAGEAGAQSAAGQCPEPRTTPRAPESYQRRVNPLPSTAENLERGRALYQQVARPEPCANCHGASGDGRGPAGQGLVPPPRNFACAPTMDGISDGQLFWVIENGSGDYHRPARQGAQTIERPARGTPSTTAMRGHKDYLSDTDIWSLVLYLRSLERRQGGGPQ